MSEKKRITAADVIGNLRSWFAQPQYAFLEQVADGTGMRQSRWADAVAMSVWPSRGYDIHGVEVKVSRYDWQKELSQPLKSAAVQQYCNRWWVATPDELIIQPGELPPTWGHMVMKGNTMRVAVAAPPLEPKPVTVEFVASVLRNYQKADESEVRRAIDDAVREAVDHERESERNRYGNLKKQVEAFEEKSGIRINEYVDGKELGEAVDTLRGLKWKLGTIESAVRACDDVRQMLDKVQELASLREVVHVG